MPASTPGRKTAQASGSYTPRPSVLLQIDNAAGLANAPLPQVVKDNLLRDGLGDEAVFVDRDVAKAIADGTATTKFAAYVTADSKTTYNSSEGLEDAGRRQALKVTAQGVFCDSGWRDYTVTKPVTYKNVSDVLSNSGVDLELDSNLEGSATVQVAIQYKKSDWSACLPYAFRFKHATAKGTVDLNNARVALTAAVSKTVAKYSAKSDLYKYDGMFWIGPVPVWYTVVVPFEYGFKVILGAAATAEYSTQMSGKMAFDYVCKRDNCTGTTDTSTVKFTNSSPNWGIQGDATFDPFVSVGAEGRIYPISDDKFLASAGVGFKFSTPFMVYGYTGKTCGDSNNDGVNENIQTNFADMQARLSLFASWTFVDAGKTIYISGSGPKTTGALERALSVENNHTPIWRANLYFNELTSSNPGMFSPILRQQAGYWNGSSYEHLLRVSMRPCVPFESTYQVDIKDSTGAITKVSLQGKASTVQTRVYSASPTMALSAVATRDSEGRVFKNAGTAAPKLGLGDDAHSGLGTFTFVSMSQTMRGSGGDVMTITLKNTGTSAINAISHSCTGLSWHGWGTTPSTIAAGASANFQCSAAASGAYTPPTVTVYGSATNSPFKPTL